MKASQRLHLIRVSSGQKGGLAGKGAAKRRPRAHYKRIARISALVRKKAAKKKLSTVVALYPVWSGAPKKLRQRRKAR
jgi:hypothetical protein